MDLYLEVTNRELCDPDTVGVANDLEEIFLSVVRLQTRTVAGPVLIDLVAEAQLTPQRTKLPLLSSQCAGGQGNGWCCNAQSGVASSGRIRDIDLVIDVLGGAVALRLLQWQARPTAAFAGGLVRLVLDGPAPDKTKV
jgi:hypothetical protein